MNEEQLTEVVHFFHSIAEDVIKTSSKIDEPFRLVINGWEVRPLNISEEEYFPLRTPRVGWDNEGLVVYWYAAGAPVAYKPHSKHLREWAEFVRDLIGGR